MSGPDLPALRAELAALRTEVGRKYRYYEALTTALNAAEVHAANPTGDNLHRAEQTLGRARLLKPGS